MNMFVDLIFNMGMIVSTAIISGSIAIKWPERIRTRFVQGLLFGSIAAIGMFRPFYLQPGIFFDGRSISVSLCAQIFGLPAALPAVLMTSAVRVSLGGGGMVTGLLTILTSALSGLAFHRLYTVQRGMPSFRQLLANGILTHILLLLCMFSLPGGQGPATIRTLALPLLVIFPATSLLAGWIINLFRSLHQSQLRLLKESNDAHNRMRDSARILQTIASSSLDHEKNIFEFLTHQLASFLGAGSAIIALLQPRCSGAGPEDRSTDLLARSLAAYHRGRFLENFDFPVAGPLPRQEAERMRLQTADCPELKERIPGSEDVWSIILFDAEGEACGILALLDARHHRTDSYSKAIMRIVAARAESELERRGKEEQYQLLFNSMLEGFAIHDIICDEGGNAVDYRFVAVNPAFCAMTGLTAEAVVGKRVLEVLPQTEEYWITSYGRVALLGETLTFEAYSQNLNRFYLTTAFQMQYKRFACIITDITDRRLSESRIRQNLKEKELLLREIHHRVKNNLNIVASLLNLQSGSISSQADALEAFENCRDQIMSMALVHEELYQSENYANINMHSFINRLRANLSAMHYSKKGIQYLTEVQDVELDVNKAIPCSLILNELITNSYKYAFDGRDGGSISIRLFRLNQDEIRLEYRDDGPGLPAHLDIDSLGSLGLKLVHILCEQIDARLSIERQAGLCYLIDIPSPPSIHDLSAMDGATDS